MTPEETSSDNRMDADALYREEVFTDRRVGTIRRLTPVKADGSPDDSRDVLYSGQAQVLTPAGALPLSFELEARTLDEAVEKFGEAAQTAVEHTLNELQEMRREAASSIVVPKGDQGGFGGGGPTGGMPGGGGIQVP